MADPPLLGAIAVVVTDTHVMLARRKNPPDAGLWGFPGGHVERGETALNAAARELLEETGIVARPVGYLTNIDIILRDAAGQVDVHFLLAAVYCEYISGTPIPADDVSDAQWITCEEIRTGILPTSDRVCEVMELALRHRHTLSAAPRA